MQSKPNRFLGVSVAQQAEYDAIAEKIAWSNGRVAAFSQYLLLDDPLGGKPGSSVNGGTIGFQTGLEYITGKPKPLVLRLAGAADRVKDAATASRCGASCARRSAPPS